ncbi:MAG: hypothetical protein EOO08_13675 [Chitinophagaceae bacterium]|nr:MAG: hypothetical protein EOO08_13675 [Chitinophagaceae bacterium]
MFEMNEDLPPESTDVESGAFVELISTRLSEAYQALQEGCAECGIELQEPTETEWEEMRANDKALEARMEETELIRSARSYARSVELLLTQSPVWERKGKELAQATTLGIRSVEQGLSEVDLLADCRHVLGWYQYFIEVKFRRALHGLYTDRDDALEQQSGVHGSAKIALLAVERSRVALTSLLHLVGDDDGLLDLLAQLERIEREGRATFPGALGFVRPGFDENQNS